MLSDHYENFHRNYSAKKYTNGYPWNSNHLIWGFSVLCDFLKFSSKSNLSSRNIGAPLVFRRYTTYRRHFFNKTMKKVFLQHKLCRFEVFCSGKRFPSLERDIFGYFRSCGTDEFIQYSWKTDNFSALCNF